MIETANTLRETVYAGAGGGNVAVSTPAYGLLWSHSAGKRRASHVTVNLNVPAILTGPQFELGASVFADGRAALELARIDLVLAGVPKDILDTLTTEQVSLRTVRVPFLFLSTAATDVVASTAPVRKSRRKKVAPESAGFVLPPEPGRDKPAPDRVNLPMPQYALLLGLDCKLGPTNRGLEYRARTDDGSVPGQHEGIVVILNRMQFGPVRVDILLDESYLQSHGWAALDSWRTAYADDRYRSIFAEVRALFRLDEQNLCLDQPNSTVEAYFRADEQDILREYFKGGSDYARLLDPAWRMSDRQKKREMKGVRKRILDTLAIDIDIPWEKLRRLGCPALSRNLVYPGDFKPDAEQAPSYFCQANWPVLLNGLSQAYQEVVYAAV